MQRDSLDPSNSDLWADLILPHQTAQDMYSSAQVSRAWHIFYKRPATWKQALSVHFNIPLTTLNLFEIIVFNVAGIEEFDYQRLCRSMYAVHHHQYPLSIDAETLADPANHLPLLACCLDNVAVAKKVLPKNLNDVWRQAAIAADSVQIFTTLLYPGIVHYLPGNNDYQHAARVNGARAIFQYYLQTELPTLSADQRGRQFYFKLGVDRFCHVKYLIDNAAMFNINIDSRIADELVKNKHVPLLYLYELLKKLIAEAKQPVVLRFVFLSCLADRNDLEPIDNKIILNKIIYLLWQNHVRFDGKISSFGMERLLKEGYVEYLKYLLANDMIMLTLQPDLLVALSKSRCLVRTPLSYWFDECHPWAMQCSEELLNWLISFDALDVFKQLLSPANGFQFRINEFRYLFINAAGAKNPQFLRFLLDNYAAETSKPKQEVLDAAVIHGRPENVSILLEPAYGLKPTDANLTRAVETNQFEMIEMFLDEKRQYGLTLTEHLLSIACLPRLLESRFFRPNLTIIKCLLQPRYGMSVTQQFFDSLQYPHFSRYRNETDILMFLLGNYNVELTQEKYEALFCDADMFGIVSLPTTYRERFGHLKPTVKMLNHAIQRRMVDEFADELTDAVRYMLQPVFNLEVSARSFELDLVRGNDTVRRLVFPRINESPSLPEITRISDIALLRDVLEKYAINMVDYLPIALVNNTSTEILMFLLERATQAGLLRQQNRAYIYEGRLHKTLEQIILLYDPALNIQFDQPAMPSDRSISSIMYSDHFMKLCCFPNLKLGDTAAAERLFDHAYEQSPQQCFRVATFALTHPDQYQLSDDARDKLGEFIVKTANKFEELSIVELIAIRDLLSTAYFRLRDHYEYELSDELPIAVINKLVDKLLVKQSHPFPTPS